MPAGEVENGHPVPQGDAAFFASSCDAAVGWGWTIWCGWIGSLSHLSILAPDYIRITPSLVRDVGESKSSAALVRAPARNCRRSRHHDHRGGGGRPGGSLQRLQELGLAYAQGRVVAPREPLECWLEGAVLRHL